MACDVSGIACRARERGRVGAQIYCVPLEVDVISRCYFLRIKIYFSVLLSWYSPLALRHGSILSARADTVCALYRYKELLAKKKATSAVQVAQEEQTVTSSPSGA